MRYLGIDVHSSASVWCLLDGDGEVVRWGETQSCAAALGSLVRELMEGERLVVGQEVGTMAYMVHDAVTAAGAEVLSFNAQQLRMIASSRKKTDRRDAYWIARALQTGMHPHPVYIPTGEIRALRCLLKRRRMVLSERARWQSRGRATLRATGQVARCRPGRLGVVLEEMLRSAKGVDAHVAEMIELCQRQRTRLDYELRVVEAEIRQRAREIEPIKRLQTIPAIGPLTATMIYAWVGEVRRFPSAKTLGAYAGLVPSIRQSGESTWMGSITKAGSPQLRHTLVQAAHVLIARSRGKEAAPLQEIAARVRGSRGRRKIAVVALARHLLRIAYYILRDQTVYDASRLHTTGEEDRTVA